MIFGLAVLRMRLFGGLGLVRLVVFSGIKKGTLHDASDVSRKED